MQGLRDRASEFERAGVALVGVSFDPPEKNRAFGEREGFRGRLLSDVDRMAGAAYETVRSPNEKSPQYAKRRTYVIDPDGVIRKAYRVNDIRGHPSQVLDDLRALGAIPPGADE